MKYYLPVTFDVYNMLATSPVELLTQLNNFAVHEFS